MFNRVQPNSSFYNKREVIPASAKIAFIPHSRLSEGLRCFNSVNLLKSVKEKTCSESVELHSSESECNCEDKEQVGKYMHIVLINPKVSLSYIKSELANSFAEHSVWSVGNR